MEMKLGKPQQYLERYNDLPVKDFNEFVVLRLGVNAGNRLMEQVLDGENPDPEIYFTYLEDDQGNLRFKVHSRRDLEELCIVTVKKEEEFTSGMLEA